MNVIEYLSKKKLLILDMNGTFMFGQDRFSNKEDFSIFYRKIDGKLQKQEFNNIILTIYEYLDNLYAKEEYFENFPTLYEVIEELYPKKFSIQEIAKIIKVFSFYELGHISKDYIRALIQLQKNYELVLLSDIWSPKDLWIEYFEEIKIKSIFSKIYFSSEYKIVKPSKKLYDTILKDFKIDKSQCLVIGDSISRDLKGSINAQIDCVLIGSKKSELALKNFNTFLEFANKI